MSFRIESPTRRSITTKTIFIIVTLLLSSFTAINIFAQKNKKLKPNVGKAVKFDISPPLRSMKPKPMPVPEGEVQESEDDLGEPGPIGDTRHSADGALQEIEGNGIFNRDSLIPPTTVSFDGIGATGFAPPDTVGDVGPNHYVQMVNVAYQVFNKDGTSALGPININTLWTGFGGRCEATNAGDPVVLYDQMADRWLVTQFAGNSSIENFNCVALSQTSDPTGAYYRYAFSTGTHFPDYPKYGIWSDGYYISTREFPNAGGVYQIGAYALERDQMLLGNATPQVVSFLVTTPASQIGDGLLPADLDGTTLPPAGSPQYFVGSMDEGFTNYGATADALNLFKFSVNWVTPASSTFGFSNQLNVAAFDSVFPCIATSRDCIPQPGTTSRIDVQSYRQRVLHRLAYRNLGTHESLVTSQSVEAQVGIAGMRWYEIRSPNASPTIHQQGTYSPDLVHRWMGSVAMDKKGNMMMGYSVSDATTVFPGIRFTGRLATDTLGTMPQGEGVMVAGAGSQLTTSRRWGDYSSMNIDPVDDCTFWYTTQYYTATSSAGWRTRISSAIFPGCAAVTAAGVSVSGRVRTSTGRGLKNVIVKITATGDGETRFARTNQFGYYKFEDISSGGNYILSASSKRYVFTSQVIFLSDNLTNLDFTAENVGSETINNSGKSKIGRNK